LGAKEEEDLRNFYVKLKTFFLEKISLGKFIISSPDGDCSLIGEIFQTPKKFKYPYITFEYRFEVEMIECPCNPVGDATKVKSAFFTISCTSIESVRSGKQGPLRDPIDPKINIVREECCPGKEGKEEESQSSLNDAKDDDKGSFQVSAHVGLPLGDEKDFYSLNVGADAAYLFNLSEHFSAGAGAGYTHFTGKDNIEGTGFIPIFGIAQYDLSDKFSLRVNGGYAISTETDGRGGVYIGLGVGLKIKPNISIGPSFSSINLDGGSFNSVTIGITGTF